MNKETTTMDTIDQQATEATPIDAAPVAGPQKKRRWWRRLNRKGLGSTELTLLILVIIIVGLLGGFGLQRALSARGGAEHAVVKRNIETIAQYADTYWNSYAADADGRRKINMGDFCHYVNNQLAGGDIKLRTLILSEAGAASDPANDPVTDFTATGLALNVDVGTNTADTALCASRDGGTLATTLTQNEGYSDIIAYPDNAVKTVLAVVPAVAASADGVVVAPTTETRRSAIESIGLRSTDGVWMAIYGDGAALANNFAPGGTDTTYDATANASNTQRGVEYIVIGGVAPDGHSFCMLKVFDASDNTDIGEYRQARLPQDDDQFAVCSNGFGATGDAQMIQGDWPEPR